MTFIFNSVIDIAHVYCSITCANILKNLFCTINFISEWAINVYFTELRNIPSKYQPYLACTNNQIVIATKEVYL